MSIELLKYTPEHLTSCFNDKAGGARRFFTTTVWIMEVFIF